MIYQNHSLTMIGNISMEISLNEILTTLCICQSVNLYISLFSFETTEQSRIKFGSNIFRKVFYRIDYFNSYQIGHDLT